MVQPQYAPPVAGYPTYYPPLTAPGHLPAYGYPVQQKSSTNGDMPPRIPAPEGYDTQVAPDSLNALPPLPDASGREQKKNPPRAVSFDPSRLPPHVAAGLQQYGSMIETTARTHGLSPSLLAALVNQESKFKADAYNKGSQATGLGQLLPGTAAEMGVRDIHDPAENLNGSAKYLAQQLKTHNGNVALALASYNFGPGNVQRYLRGEVSLPAETRNYIEQIPALQAELEAAGYPG
jgi:soluble lytic murein transglycosylase-like protein